MISSLAIPDEVLINKIYFIRGHKVMLDTDLAELYAVETRVLKQAVRRNLDRFPEDFMFELTPDEWSSLRSQFVTLKRGGHSKYPPFAFTEHGVLMLSSVLKSDRATQVNIRIMRVYTKMKEVLLSNKDILLKLEKLERKSDRYDEDIQLVFSAVKKLLQQPKPPKRNRIGFRRGNEKE